MSRYGSAGNGWVYWVLPAAFALHDAEELATLPAWVVSNRSQVEALLASIGAGHAVTSLPTTFARAGTAIGFMMIIFVVATAGIRSHPASSLWRVAYGGLLGALFIHAFTHVTLSVLLGGYTPGVVTAVLVAAPASLLAYRSLTRLGALDACPTAVASAVALLLFIPVVWFALTLAAWLAPG